MRVTLVIRNITPFVPAESIVSEIETFLKQKYQSESITTELTGIDAFEHLERKVNRG